MVINSLDNIGQNCFTTCRIGQRKSLKSSILISIIDNKYHNVNWRSISNGLLNLHI